MFREPTVFVLGAGASWHYGLPTGEQLARNVIEEAVALRDHYDRCGNFGLLTGHAKSKGPPDKDKSLGEINTAAKRDCQELIRRLKSVNPLVIDYFLAQNPALQDIGRFAIALAILKAEANWIGCHANLNRQYDVRNSPIIQERKQGIDIHKCEDDWLRFVLSHMVSECASAEDVLKSEVRFVTFNYDTSLERRIAECLDLIEIFQGLTMEAFLRDARIIHVYGQVGKHSDVPIRIVESPVTKDDAGKMAEYTNMLDHAWKASKGIRTISDQKEGDGNDIRVARELLMNAKDTGQINRSYCRLIAVGLCSSIQDGIHRPGCRASSSRHRSL